MSGYSIYITSHLDPKCKGASVCSLIKIILDVISHACTNV